MKKVILLSIVALISATSFSQSKGGGTNLSAGVELGLPMGDFGDFAKLGMGASVKALFGDKSGFTASAGYMSFASKFSGFSASSFIPVKVGYRMASEGGFYFEPQVGMTFISGNGSSTSGFTYAPSVGMTTGSFDVSARYEGVSTTGSTTSFVGLRLAYSFGGK